MDDPGLNNIFEGYVEFIHPNHDTYNFLQRQYFSIPFDIINYITQNPKSAYGLLKLQKSCKYFFAKNKIVVINNYVDHAKHNELNCGISTTNASNIHSLTFNGIFKYWPNYFYSIFYDGNQVLYLNHMYRCTVEELHIFNKTISLKDFNFLLGDSNKIESLNMSDVNIYDDRGSLITCYQILSKVSNLENFQYECKEEIFTTEIFEKMNSLEFKTKFYKFYLAFFQLSPNIDFSPLCEFIRKNMEENLQFGFDFNKIDFNLHYDAFITTINEELLTFLKHKDVSVELTYDEEYIIFNQN